MFQIPNNVMQIGEIDPHIKIYMEDYVHTFLERAKGAETYLVFGKKEERDGLFYYMIYGVEKKTDWERGSFPYFKKYERIGTLEGQPEKRLFKPVRGNAAFLEGYFVFYEMNEDMQSYMIASREAEEATRSEEKEEVLEAVRLRREKNRRESQQEGASLRREPGRRENQPENVSVRRGQSFRENQPESASVRHGQSFRESRSENESIRRETRPERAPSFRERMRQESQPSPPVFGRRERKPKSGGHPFFTKKEKAGREWTLAGVCRMGSVVLLIFLVGAGMNSFGKSGRKPAKEIFSDVLNVIKGENGFIAAGAEPEEGGLVVEEITAGTQESGEATEAEQASEQADAGGKIVWMIGTQEGTDMASEAESADSAETEGVQEGAADSAEKADAQEEADSAAADTQTFVDPAGSTAAAGAESGAGAATQAIARPVTYVVKKGDSLAQIARKFYGSAERLEEICKLNGITDPNHIQPGQNLLLP